MNPSNILSELKQRIQNNLQFLDRLFLLNSCAWTGMFTLHQRKFSLKMKLKK